jgi:hypothetical protein
MIFIPGQICSGDQIENNEMCVASSKYGGGKMDLLEDTDVDGWIILRWISGSGIWGHGLDRSGSGQGQVVGTCECGNAISGSIKCGEFLEWLRTG